MEKAWPVTARKWLLVVVILGLIVISPFGIPWAIINWYDVFTLRADELPELSFDALFWLLFVGVASVLAVFARSSSFPGYGRRRFLTATCFVLVVCQLFGLGWEIMDSFYEFIHHQHLGRLPKNERKRLLKTEWTEATALTLGILGMWTTALCLFPLSRASPLFLALGIPLDACLKGHALLGRVTVVLLSLHFLGYVAAWKFDEGWALVREEIADWPDRGVNNLAGVVGLAFLVVSLGLLAAGIVRRRLYEVFYRTHLLGLVGFVAFASMHYRGFANYVAAALAMWIADLGRRLVDVSTPVSIVAKVYDRANLVHLRIPNPSLVSAALHADPSVGIFVSIQVPSISWLQWHPFSCYPKNDGGSFDCWVRALGGWTSHLIFESSPIRARLGGVSAAGWPMELRGADALLVAGGTGIVPLLGFFTQPRNGNVTVLWSVRHVEDVQILSSVTAVTTQASLTIFVHYTGKSENLAQVEEATRQLEASKVTRDEARLMRTTSALTMGKSGLMVIAALYFVSFLGGFIGLFFSQDGKGLTDEDTDSWQIGLALLLNVTCFALFPTLTVAGAVAIGNARNGVEHTISEVTNPAHDPEEKVDIGGAAQRPWTAIQVAAGRPDIQAYVNKAPGKLKVFASGPASLVDSASRACSSEPSGLFLKANVDFEAVSYDVADL